MLFFRIFRYGSCGSRTNRANRTISNVFVPCFRWLEKDSSFGMALWRYQDANWRSNYWIWWVHEYDIGRCCGSGWWETNRNRSNFAQGWFYICIERRESDTTYESMRWVIRSISDRKYYLSNVSLSNPHAFKTRWLFESSIMVSNPPSAPFGGWIEIAWWT